MHAITHAIAGGYCDCALYSIADRMLAVGVRGGYTGNSTRPMPECLPAAYATVLTFNSDGEGTSFGVGGMSRG